MSTNKKVVIYGGAFNPPHNGHAAVIRNIVGALDRLGLDELWIMPSGSRYDKVLRVSGEDRFLMLQAVIRDIPEIHSGRLAVSRVEIEHPEIMTTYESKRKLQELYPGYEFYFAIGADAFPNIATWWRYGKELLAEAKFLVIERPGHALPAVKDGDRVRHLPISGALFDISSTDIRIRIKKGEGIGDVVPAGVARYIEEHGLYR